MGNKCSCVGTPSNTTSNTSNQKYKLLIIGPTFSGKTTFLKALQILHGTGFDEVSNEIYKDIMIRQIIKCVQTVVEHISSDDEKMDDEISYQSEITRDHSHLSVEDVSGRQLSYSGLSVGLSSRSHIQRQNSKSTKTVVNMKKFNNPEIAAAADFFLQTKFSQSSSYFEWLANKKFIDNLKTLWNDKQIQTVFTQNYYSTTKLPYSTKFFVESILTKLITIHNELANNDNSKYGGSANDSGNGPIADSAGAYDDEKSNNSGHKKDHSRTTSLGRFNKGQENPSDINMDNLDHPKGIDSMISVPMLATQQQNGIISSTGGDGNENGKNESKDNDNRKKSSENASKNSKNGKNDPSSSSSSNSDSSSSVKNSISLRYNPSDQEILLCYHRTINRNKEKINLQNKLTFEIWDVGGSKSEMKKWILYCQRTNVVVFMVSLFQVSMLKYTLQLWESIINTKYATWFGTQRAMNELILMQSESTNRALNGGNNNGGNGGANSNGDGSGANGGRGGNGGAGGAGSGRGGYTHMYGASTNGNNADLSKLNSQSGGNGNVSEAVNSGSTVTGGGGPGGNQMGSTATTVDIARIPCVLLLNGRDRLAEMITNENLNVKQNRSCAQFFSNFNGDVRNVEAIIDFVRDSFHKALRKKESRIQVTPMTVDCIDVESVKRVFDDIQELCVTASQRGR